MTLESNTLHKSMHVVLNMQQSCWVNTLLKVLQENEGKQIRTTITEKIKRAKIEINNIQDIKNSHMSFVQKSVKAIMHNLESCSILIN